MGGLYAVVPETGWTSGQRNESVHLVQIEQIICKAAHCRSTIGNVFRSWNLQTSLLLNTII